MLIKARPKSINIYRGQKSNKKHSN